MTVKICCYPLYLELLGFARKNRCPEHCNISVASLSIWYTKTIYMKCYYAFIIKEKNKVIFSDKKQNNKNIQYTRFHYTVDCLVYEDYKGLKWNISSFSNP